MKPDAPTPLALPRRQFLCRLSHWGLAGATGNVALGSGLSLVPGVGAFAEQLHDFIEGPPVADIPAQQLSKHVWMVYAEDGFPTAENKGMMANILFVVTAQGVVVLDTGASLQIGQIPGQSQRPGAERPPRGRPRPHHAGLCRQHRQIHQPGVSGGRKRGVLSQRERLSF